MEKDMGMNELDFVENKLTTLLASGESLTLHPSDISERFIEMSEVWWPEKGLSLFNLVLGRPNQYKLTLNATIRGNEVISGASFQLQIKYENGKLYPSYAINFGNTFELAKIVGEILSGYFNSSLRLFSGLQVKNIEYVKSLEKGISFVISLSESTNLDWGGVSLSIDADTLELTLDKGQVKGCLKSTAGINTLHFPLTVYFSDYLSFEGDIANISIEDLCLAFGISLPVIPPYLSLESISRGNVKLYFDNNFPSICCYYKLDKLGLVQIQITKYSGNWTIVGGVSTPDKFRFKNIDENLAPLDALSEIVELANPAIIMSNTYASDFPWRDTSGKIIPILVSDGILLHGKLLLEGFGLKIISELIGINSLPIETLLSDAITDFSLTASLGKAIDLIPSVIQINDFTLSVKPVPFSIIANGKANVNLLGSSLPEFKLGIALSESGSSLMLSTEEPWNAPLGLPLVVKNLGIQINFPSTTIAFYGDVEIQGRIIILTTEFIGQAPSMLAGNLDGEFPLIGLVEDLVGINVFPDFIDLTLRDISMRLVSSSIGVTVLGNYYPPGLSLEGTIGFLGLELHTILSIDPTNGVRAEGNLNKPINLGPVLQITGAGGNPTPHLSIDTSTDKLMTLSSRIIFLGLEEELVAVVDQKHLSFDLKQGAGPVSINVNCELGDGSFNANGSVVVMLKGRIGPIKLISGGPNFGTINLDTGFNGGMILSVNESGTVLFNISGKFKVLGASITLPSFTIKENFSTFEELPGILIKRITEEAGELFENLFFNPTEWLSYIGKKLISLAEEEIGRTLSEYYHKTAKEISTLVHDVLDLDPKNFARVLKGASIIAEDAAKLMLELSYPDDVVKDIFRVVFPGSHIDQSFGHLDSGPSAHIDTGPKGHIDEGPHLHVNKGAKVHIDQGAKAHVNMGGSGHIDKRIRFGIGSKHVNTAAIPHVNISAKPHVNIGSKPHVNTPVVPHVNTPAIPHVNTDTIPHLDTSNHIDTSD